MNRDRFTWSPLPLRLIIGIGFMFHGYAKLFSSVGHNNFIMLLQDLGMPLPSLLAWLVGFVEFFGGLALLLGAFTSIAALLLIVDMLGAMFFVSLPHGFDMLQVTVMIEGGPKFGVPGLEINLIYLAALISLLLTGPGHLSLDGWLRARQGSAGHSVQPA
ncbi:MAG: DoxX family protein [Calditrichaeota bacterium]|nr:MAG: DoxX family protein [Calditrichota bacterium]